MPGCSACFAKHKNTSVLVMSITALHKTCFETVSFPPYLAASCSAASSSLQCRCWDVKEHEQNGFHHVSSSKVASFPSSEDDTCSEEEVSESGDSEPGIELFTLAPEKIEKSGIHDACLSRCPFLLKFLQHGWHGPATRAESRASHPIQVFLAIEISWE